MVCQISCRHNISFDIVVLCALGVTAVCGSLLVAPRRVIKPEFQRARLFLCKEDGKRTALLRYYPSSAPTPAVPYIPL